MTRILRPSLAVAAAVILLLIAASLALGDESFLGGKVRTGQSVTVPAGETVSSDLYIFAGTIVVDGTVEGDLTAVGGTVEVDGDVTGDLLASGGTVSVAGKVGGDLRSAGGNLTVSGSVAEDALLGGGVVNLSGSVGGDLMAGGGTLTVSGSVTGSIEGSAGTYSRSGSVGGSEHIVQPQRQSTAASTRNAIFDAIRHFVALVLFGALAIWLLPGVLRASDGELRRRPLLAFGGGLGTIVGYVVFVLAAVLLMVLLGIGLGLLRLGALVGVELVAGLLAIGVGTFGFVMGVAYAGDLVVGLALGRFVMPTGTTSRWQELGLLVGGAAIVVILTSLPYVGGWLKLLVVIFGLGALAVAVIEGWRARRRARLSGGATPPAPTPPAPAEPAT